MSGYWGIQILRRVGAWYCHRKLSGVHRSRQRRFREQMRVRTGYGGVGRTNQGSPETQRRTQLPKEGQRAEELLCWELLCLDFGLRQSPTPPLRARWSSPCVTSDQIRSVAQSCPTLCNPMNRSTPGLSIHHQLP